MPKHDNARNFSSAENDDSFAEEYDDLELLERLESLREDMEDLGVTTLTEVVQRIDALHQELDRHS
ncbi:MAG: hypothetical protein PVSMB5_02850 [Ktedonobacteraceae bacterium]